MRLIDGNALEYFNFCPNCGADMRKEKKMNLECTGWKCPMMNVDVKRCTAKGCPYRTTEEYKVDELIGLRIAIDFLNRVVQILEDDRRNRKNGGRDNADPD